MKLTTKLNPEQFEKTDLTITITMTIQEWSLVRCALGEKAFGTWRFHDSLQRILSQVQSGIERTITEPYHLEKDAAALKAFIDKGEI